MEKQKQQRIIFILVLVIIALAGLNSLRYFLRLDLSENQAFTIAETSKNLVRSLKEPVTITYYLSEKLDKLAPDFGDVKDLLYEYTAYSNGRVKVSIEDPDKTNSAQRLEGMGIQSQQIQLVEKNEQTYAKVFSGIVIQYLDRTDIIPWVFRTETLEYDLTSSIKNLVDNKRKSIGILLADNSRQLDKDFRFLMNQLSQKLSPRILNPHESIPADVDAVFVIGDKDIDELGVYNIDKYINNGGRVLFAADGVYVDTVQFKTVPLTGNRLLALLESYGVKVNQDLVLDEKNKDFRIPRQIMGQTMWQSLGKYPPWVEAYESFASKTNPITARFTGLDLLWPSSLTISKKDGITADPLVKTTDKAWLLTKDFPILPTMVPIQRISAEETRGQYTVAAALSGKFPGFFASQPIPPGETLGQKLEAPAAVGKDTRIIIVSGSITMADLIQYSDSLYNLTFFENSAQWLSNDEDLLKIHTRIVRDARLNKLTNPDQKAFMALFILILNLFLIPVGVGIYGIVRFMNRRNLAKASIQGQDIPDQGQQNTEDTAKGEKE